MKINLSEMTKAERQAFADFQLHERARHIKDIGNIDKDLDLIKEKYGISPRRKFVGKWIEV